MQSPKTGSLRRLQHRPQNLHPPRGAHRPRNHSEVDFAGVYGGYSQHVRSPTHRKNNGCQSSSPLGNNRGRNLSRLQPQWLSSERCVTHLLVKIFCANVSHGTFANIFRICLHFVPTVRRLHDGIIGAGICEDRTSAIRCNSCRKNWHKTYHHALCAVLASCRQSYRQSALLGSSWLWVCDGTVGSDTSGACGEG